MERRNFRRKIRSKDAFPAYLRKQQVPHPNLAKFCHYKSIDQMCSPGLDRLRSTAKCRLNRIGMVVHLPSDPQYVTLLLESTVSLPRRYDLQYPQMDVTLRSIANGPTLGTGQLGVCYILPAPRPHDRYNRYDVMHYTQSNSNLGSVVLLLRSNSSEFETVASRQPLVFFVTWGNHPMSFMKYSATLTLCLPLHA